MSLICGGSLSTYYGSKRTKSTSIIPYLDRGAIAVKGAFFIKIESATKGVAFQITTFFLKNKHIIM